MPTEDPMSSDSSPSEGRQDVTRQDRNPSDIDNDGEDLSEADDTISISGCSTPPGFKDAFGLDDLAVNDKPSQHATPADIFIPDFEMPPLAQDRHRDELRKLIGSQAPPDPQLTRILQVAGWNADIAVDIFHLWHELGPPPNRSPKIEAADIEAIVLKSAAEAAAANREMRANDESSSPAKTDREESREGTFLASATF